MKMMYFLAGLATGLLLQSRGRAGARHAVRSAARRVEDSRAWQMLGSGADQDDGQGERSYPTHAPAYSDAQLRERICSQMERTLSHPEGIQVEVEEGTVILRGQVHARDVVLLVAEVEKTAGPGSLRNEAEIIGSLDAVAPAISHDRPGVR